MGIGLADEQAKELGNESGFCLAFDLERAIEPEQHAVLALRLNREQDRARAHTRARLDRRDEANLVQSIIESGCRVRGITPSSITIAATSDRVR